MIIKNELRAVAALEKQIPKLETSKEGKLMGGFATIAVFETSETVDIKGICQGVCHFKCSNTNCPCPNPATKPPTTTPTKSADSLDSIGGFSFLF